MILDGSVIFPKSVQPGLNVAGEKWKFDRPIAEIRGEKVIELLSSFSFVVCILRARIEDSESVFGFIDSRQMMPV